MIGTAQIYVALLDERIDVWRPIWAERLDDNVYRIVDQPYERELETWQFEPGDDVACDLIESGDGRILAAIRKAR